MVRRSLLAIAVPAIALVVVACGAPGQSPAPSPGPTPSPSVTDDVATVASSATETTAVLPAPTVLLSALEGKILFARAGGQYGDETVFTVNADGTDEHQITANGGVCCPRWSPDGSHIFTVGYAADGRVTTSVFDPDGTNPRLLPLPAGTLQLGCFYAYAPATDRLACEGWSDTEPDQIGIYTIRASDGGGIVRVTDCCPVQHDFPIDFSPDGTQLYFLRAVTAFPAIGDEFGGSIFVVNVDGTDARAVTPPDVPVEVVGGRGGRLSRDGLRLIFTSRGVIMAIGADGTGLTELFRDGSGRLAITPSWSPDGEFIIFGLDPPGQLGTVDIAPNNGLFVASVQGGAISPLITSRDWKREPDWVLGA